MSTAVADNATLLQLRKRIGLDSLDLSEDANIQEAYAMTISWMETYLSRILFSETGVEVEEFVHVNQMSLSLKGYPTISVDSIVMGANEVVPDYHLLKPNGMIMCDSPFKTHMATITYTMGDPLIGALRLAMFMVFDQVWTQFNNVNDGTTSSNVKAISSDGARVEFDVNSSGNDIDVLSGLPSNVIGILNDFRRFVC